MTIYVVKGPEGTQLNTIAACLRSVFINNNKGALIVDHRDTPAELPAEATEDDKAKAATAQVKAIMKKVLTNPDMLDATVPGELKWMPGAVVVVVNDKEAILDEFEKIAPGFREQFAPVVTVTVDAPAETAPE